MVIKIIVQKRLNEDVIDYDLLEDLVCHVDETCDEGAILVFLPVSPSDSLFAFFRHVCLTNNNNIVLLVLK